MWHRNPKSKDDKLQQHCKEHGIEIPKVKIIEDNLSPEQASAEEKRIWHQYKDTGWNMINSEGKLGFLGNRFRKWTKETIV